jgi:hypothetical protein
VPIRKPPSRVKSSNGQSEPSFTARSDLCGCELSQSEVKHPKHCKLQVRFIGLVLKGELVAPFQRYGHKVSSSTPQLHNGLHDQMSPSITSSIGLFEANATSHRGTATSVSWSPTRFSTASWLREGARRRTAIGQD